VATTTSAVIISDLAEVVVNFSRSPTDLVASPFGRTS